MSTRFSDIGGTSSTRTEFVDHMILLSKLDFVNHMRLLSKLDFRDGRQYIYIYIYIYI